jgi:hypothetical protein
MSFFLHARQIFATVEKISAPAHSPLLTCRSPLLTCRTRTRSPVTMLVQNISIQNRHGRQRVSILPSLAQKIDVPDVWKIVARGEVVRRPVAHALGQLRRRRCMGMA